MTEKVAVIVHLCQTQVQPAQEKMKLTYGVNQLRAAMILCAAALSLLLSGCSTMKIDEVASDSPQFRFEEYFAGHTKASGWFTDRFGKVRRHFCGDFFGQQQDDGFLLDEVLYYTDGVVEKRQWLVNTTESGDFRAEAEALIGGATGMIKGNALEMNYVMRVDLADGKQWQLSMNDWMFYQADGSLHNATFVSKWGFRIGVVTTQYTKHDGELLCSGSKSS